ncbi:hypothetical protein [Acinetobacter oleivorans]|uniref:hypothetical protein n=1 Tax=Acinetobacter oleivorans TaxID=1148157 RepID=UPI00124F97C7|nr:hypothetical protein [Acinetobacter oleivorans]
MRRLRQRQRQQRNIWAMLEIKRNKQSAIMKISDIITKKQEYKQEPMNSLKIIKGLDNEINYCLTLSGALSKEVCIT